MDDSDEEYLARAAVFTEKLILTLQNPAQEPSPPSSKVQAAALNVPKSSKNDAKFENPVPINKTEVRAPHRQLVPIGTDDKKSPEKRQEEAAAQKPPQARIPRVGFTRVLLPEARSKSTNPTPTKIAVRPSIPEHHRKSFGGTGESRPGSTTPQQRQEVELQETQKPQISESRSKSLNRIPENHRKSFGGTVNYQKVPIKEIVASETKEPMSKEVELKTQKPSPTSIQVAESQLISKIRSRPTNDSVTASTVSKPTILNPSQKTENTANSVSKPSVPDQKILKKSDEGEAVEPQNPAQRTESSVSVNNESTPAVPEVRTKSFGSVRIRQSFQDVEVASAENRSKSANPAQRTESTISANNESAVPEVRTKSFGAVHQKTPRMSEGSEDISATKSIRTPHVQQIQAAEAQVSESRSKSANPAQRNESSVSVNNESTPAVPEVRTKSFGSVRIRQTFQDVEVISAENRAAQRNGNSVLVHQKTPRMPEGSNPNDISATRSIKTPPVEQIRAAEAQISENRSKSANPLQRTESSVSVNINSTPAVPEVRTKSFGSVRIRQTFQDSEMISAENRAVQRDENSVSANNQSRPAIPVVQTKSFGANTRTRQTFQDVTNLQTVPTKSEEIELKKDIPATRSTFGANTRARQTFQEVANLRIPTKSEESEFMKNIPATRSTKAENSVNNVPETHTQKAPEKSDEIAAVRSTRTNSVSEDNSTKPLQTKPVITENRSNSAQKTENSVLASNGSRPEIQTKSFGMEHILEKPEESSATRPVTSQQPGEHHQQTESHVPNVCVQQPLMRKSRPMERCVRPILDIPTQIEPPLPPSTEPMPTFQQFIPEQQSPRFFPPVPSSSVPSFAVINNFSRPRAAAVTRPPIPSFAEPLPVQRNIPNQQQPLRISSPVPSSFARPRANAATRPPFPPAGFSRDVPRPNQNRPPPPTRPPNNRMNDEINQLCAGVSDLTIADPDFHLETRQRTRVQQPNPMQPIVGSSAPVQDQTTWVEEQTNHRNQRFPMNNNQYNPGESLIGSSEEEEDVNDITVEPINPAGEYPEMFTSFRRQLAEEENRSLRNHHVTFRDTSIVDLGRNNNEPERPPPSPIIRSNTPVVRRPPLLPPIAKGRIPERREVLPPISPISPLFGPPTNVPTTSNNMPAASFDSADSAINKPTKEERNKTEHLESADAQYLTNLNPEDLEKMSEEELQQVTNSFYESGPRLKFKQTFPFMAEGIVQKDCETGQLKVYSQRLGRIMLEDQRWKKTEDYVYFVAIKPGVNRGLWFDVHPKCLVSAKFPSVEKLVIRGYAILAHPNGSREDSIKESRWICWNDSLGLMQVISGAARIPLKKQPVWDKQLDIVSIHANFENRRFVVTKLVALTNSREKKDKFPDEVFLVQDAIFKRQCEDDLLFHSAKLNAPILIKRTLVGEVHTFEQRAFELVVVPTFPRSNTLEFRSMLIIDNPQQFWKREKEWIRELLIKKAESYDN
ncbi:hypothetical protein CAEBREN_19079 [Caenorhabditis brenneri]|uniref:Uncharacterized protein n=1 Tax=Caenorhabditis brenneri TaxID=135651 RepID=G0P731_CAEBE|nr:hypothetical protein CAEBREN_19079 [Caenorhabditis brenneri]